MTLTTVDREHIGIMIASLHPPHLSIHQGAIRNKASFCGIIGMDSHLEPVSPRE